MSACAQTTHPTWYGLYLQGVDVVTAARAMRSSPATARKNFQFMKARHSDEQAQYAARVQDMRESEVAKLLDSSWPLDDLKRYATAASDDQSKAGHVPGLSTSDRCPELVGANDRVSRHCWER